MELNYRKINYSITFFIILSALFSLAIFSPVLAAEEPVNRINVLGGLNDTAEGSGYKTGELVEGEENASGQIAVIVGQIIRVIISVLGIIFAILVFIGGFDIVAANGNEELVKMGKERIKNGAIGVLVVLVSYVITALVVGWVTGGGSAFKL